mmetsp:Transcript_7625/g.17828  ORF Transcript_7625/g.17828 Transcript_7625/m.17828 type:complete len:200 (-) Transcript_7625:119-718(-)
MAFVAKYRSTSSRLPRCRSSILVAEPEPDATSQPTPQHVSSSAEPPFLMQPGTVGKAWKAKYGDATTALVHAQPLTQPKVASMRESDCSSVALTLATDASRAFCTATLPNPSMPPTVLFFECPRAAPLVAQLPPPPIGGLPPSDVRPPPASPPTALSIAEVVGFVSAVSMRYCRHSRIRTVSTEKMAVSVKAHSSSTRG